ncbi:MAG: hypothetical protein BJ554DRAFT_5987, partial [Olpidium bornovanus]
VHLCKSHYDGGKSRLALGLLLALDRFCKGSTVAARDFDRHLTQRRLGPAWQKRPSPGHVPPEYLGPKADCAWRGVGSLNLFGSMVCQPAIDLFFFCSRHTRSKLWDAKSPPGRECRTAPKFIH